MMTLNKVEIFICDDCLKGGGKECHTPGCGLSLNTINFPIDKRLYHVLEKTEPFHPDLKAERSLWLDKINGRMERLIKLKETYDNQ